MLELHRCEKKRKNLNLTLENQPKIQQNRKKYDREIDKKVSLKLKIDFIESIFHDIAAFT